MKKFTMARAPSPAREARAPPSPKTRKHGYALLSEGVGAMAATATTFCYSKLEYQRLSFRGSKLKHEI